MTEADEITLLREALANMLAINEFMRLNSTFGQEKEHDDVRIARCLRLHKFPFAPYTNLDNFTLDDFRKAHEENNGALDR